MPRAKLSIVTRLFALSLGLVATVMAGDPGPANSLAPHESFSAEQRDHWAYKAPTRPDPPKVKETAWVRNTIDKFVLAAIEENGLTHAREADRVALIRRLTYDLTGLPPTPAEVDAFLNDRRSDAYEHLVDKLLASPHYGERWAQHWLDLAHYADSNGFELDAERPDAWRYRDWLVSALNTDMPYDRFLTLQLAGDEVAPGDTNALIATGFCRCGPYEVVGGNIDPAVKRQSELTEITGTVGSVFLGLTVGCARCHDHKFDPLPTTDYYRLQSFFAASRLVERSIATKEEQAAYQASEKAVQAKIAPLRKKMGELEAPYRKALGEKKKASLTEAERAILATPAKQRTPAQKRLAEGIMMTLNITWEEVAAAVSKNSADHTTRERLKREIYALTRTIPRPPAHAMAIADNEKTAPDTFVYRRGDPKNKGPMVAPRPPGILLVSQRKGAFPEALNPLERSTGRRAALAAWMTRPDNPLTARVLVNRLWQHHFGRGIVATPSDFGVRGEEPSHPELLDWLATELVAGGWKLKPLHRLMVTSAAYRQSSEPNPKNAEADPENSLLWHMNRRRLDAESLRDAMLTASGELNPKAGGPGVHAPIEKEVEDLIFTEAEVVELWPTTPEATEHLRRSLYLFRKRNVRYPMLEAFDSPDSQTACPQRAVSTHALQALVMLNSDFAAARAKALATRLYREAGGRPEAMIDRAYRVVLARPPRGEEIARARTFIESQTSLLRQRVQRGLPVAVPADVPPETESAEAAAWVDFALAMLNRNEFVYVP